MFLALERSVLDGCRMSTAEGLLEAVRERIRAGNIELPVFPSSASEVIALCEAPEVDARKLAEVIRRDATMAGHFLALANSAAFGGGRTPLVTLQQALTRLGLTQTKQIAIVVACKTRAFVVPDRPERAEELLQHGFATALFAQEIARARRLNVEEAFLAGLLHDIGEPAVLTLCAEVQRSTGRFYETRDIDACASQLHEELGGMIAMSWNMRGPIVDAIAGHHAARATQRTAIVQLADTLAHGERNLMHHPATDLLNLYPDDIERLITKVAA
jgi:putative nucleotidyltransferase with HDIG domain